MSIKGEFIEKLQGKHAGWTIAAKSLRLLAFLMDVALFACISVELILLLAEYSILPTKIATLLVAKNPFKFYLLFGQGAKCRISSALLCIAWLTAFKVYSAVWECSPLQATPGKYCYGLRVYRFSLQRLRMRDTILRNGVKVGPLLLPFFLIIVARLILEGDRYYYKLVVPYYLLAYVLVLIFFVYNVSLIFFNDFHQTQHDRNSGTFVAQRKERRVLKLYGALVLTVALWGAVAYRAGLWKVMSTKLGIS